MTELIYLLRIGLSILLGLFVGYEREKNDKDAGLRTITLITLGATLIVIFSLHFVKITKELNITFDAIRAIAYYLVAIGFVGGGIITRNKKHLQGLTTASLLLPMAIIGLLCGIGEYFLAILSGLLVYFILKLKYIRIKIITRSKQCRKKQK